MSEQLFADDPIMDGGEDKLDRKTFAEQVAKVCLNVGKESSSSVVALVGAWGSGKSSIISLVKDELEKGNWTIAEFNPWLLSDLEALVLSFFNEILNAIPTDAKNKAELRAKLSGYAKNLAPLGKLGGLIGVDVSEVIKKASDLIGGDQSLTKKRDELAKELEKLKQPILVIMDDIDRLHPDELLMVFKLVRLVGRLPNLHYLLSYDEETLLGVIAQTGLSKGDLNRARSYLEKMVQVKLDLPHMNAAQQLKLINLSLDEVLRRNSITLDEVGQKRLSEAFRDCLSIYLTQPRAIKRYFAHVEALYPLVIGEVNFTDFTLLTFLRTFEPNVYQTIIEHQNELTGQSFMADFRDEKLPERKARWEQLVKDAGAKNPEAIMELLAILFLPIKSAVEDQNYGGSYFKDEHDQKRVGNKDYFERYFIFGIPSDDIPDTELARAARNLMINEKDAILAINDLLNRNADLTLRKLKALQKEEKISGIGLMRVLARRYNDLPRAEGMFSVPPHWNVWDIIRSGYDQMSPKERLAAFEEISKIDRGLLMLKHTFTPGEKEKPKPIAQSLKTILRDKLNEVMSRIAIKDVPKLSDLDVEFIYAYQYEFGINALNKWLWERVENQNWDPISFLTRLVPESTAYTSSGVEKRLGDLSNVVVEEYFGIDRLLDYSAETIKKVPNNPDPYATRSEKPTTANKKAYVLRLLKNRYDNKLAEKTSAEEAQNQANETQEQINEK